MHPEDKKTIYPASHYLKNLEESLKDRGEAPKLPITSLPRFNRSIWGLSRGLTVIGARTSQGKTSFTLQIALDLLKQNKVVVLVSLEMSQEEIIERMFCNYYEIDNYELLTGIFNRETEEAKKIRMKYGEFCMFIENSKFVITYGHGKTYKEVNEIIERMPESPDLVIVDYIQGIKTGTRDERAETNEYIRYFRQLSYEKNFCGILVSQINRGALHVTSNEPHMGQLKGTGLLEEHADKVILLHWDYHYTSEVGKENDYKIILAKNRNGKTGQHDKVKFYPQYYKFSEPDPKEYYTG